MAEKATKTAQVIVRIETATIDKLAMTISEMLIMIKGQGECSTNVDNKHISVDLSELCRTVSLV